MQRRRMTDYPCRWCGAKPGNPCRQKDKRPTEPHLDRRRQALRYDGLRDPGHPAKEEAMTVGELKAYLASHVFHDDSPVLLRAPTGGNFVQRAATAGRRHGDGGLILSVDMDVHAQSPNAGRESLSEGGN